MESARTYTGEGIISEASPDVSPHEDTVLVRQVQEGDSRSFDLLIHKYRTRLYSVIYNLTSNREDASDLTQEVLIKAFQNIHKFRYRSSFFTWLYRIAINHTLSALRKNRLRRYFSFDTIQEELAPEEVMEKLTVSQSTGKTALLNELQEKFNEALQKLSARHRAVVVLHEVDQLSLVEIAQILECPEATVRSRLHYARKQLQAELSPYLSTQ
jgi:RNA polymerase sigma-70 factor (ECF subfamily)